MTEPKSKNITPVAHGVQRAERERKNGHRGGVLWLTGMPASGKSTLALRLEQRLYQEGVMAYVPDGDNIRGGLSADLGFSPADRSENLRRVAEGRRFEGDDRLLQACAGSVRHQPGVSPVPLTATTSEGRGQRCPKRPALHRMEVNIVDA